MLAVRELKDALGSVSVERLGPDLGLMTADGLTIEEVAAHCEGDPLVFTRHLATEVDRVRSHLGAAAVRAVKHAELGPDIAVQAWASGMPTIGFGAAEAAQESSERYGRPATSRFGPVRRTRCRVRWSAVTQSSA